MNRGSVLVSLYAAETRARAPDPRRIRASDGERREHVARSSASALIAFRQPGDRATEPVDDGEHAIAMRRVA